MLFTYALVELSQSCSSHQTAVSLLHATRRLLRQPVHFMRGRVRCSKRGRPLCIRFGWQLHSSKPAVAHKEHISAGVSWVGRLVDDIPRKNLHLHHNQHSTLR